MLLERQCLLVLNYLDLIVNPQNLLTLPAKLPIKLPAFGAGVDWELVGELIGELIAELIVELMGERTYFCYVLFCVRLNSIKPTNTR